MKGMNQWKKIAAMVHLPVLDAIENLNRLSGV